MVAIEVQSAWYGKNEMTRTLSRLFCGNLLGTIWISGINKMFKKITSGPCKISLLVNQVVAYWQVIFLKFPYENT